MGQQRQGVDRNPLRENKGDRPGREALENFRRLEQLRMMKLLDLLQLDREMEDGFVERFKTHHRNMFQIMRSQKRKIDDLADGLRKENMTDTEILKMVEELNQIEENKNKTMTDFMDELQEILTAEQLGKVYVFQARFGQEVFEKMQKFNKR